jgi:transglutaminase-like putative cysteine protease
MTPEGATDGWFFAGSALAYLALLLAERPKRYVPVLAVGAVAVISGLVVPGWLPSTDITATHSGPGPSVATGVNPMLHLGDDLRENDKHVALTYSTVSDQPEYLRLVEVSDFFSKDWGPSQPFLDTDNRPVDMPRPPGLAVGVNTEKEVTYIHVANLVSPWLPIPYPASSVTGLTGSWQYLPNSLTIASNLTLARGENYTVSSVKIAPSPAQLLAAGTTVPAGLHDYLSLPPDTPRIIATTAARVTAGETSNYQKALAIQQYLRSAPFEYSEVAPVTDDYDGTGVEYVAAFLEQHRGYCIHFASAMAVMARELGIPSRIIVGFQPGHLKNGDDQGRHIFEVTTADLHAWPELYFSGIGWVRFEPTPSRGSVPDYANQSTAGVPPVPVPGTGSGSPSTGDHSGAGPQIDEGPTVARWLTSGESSSLFAIGGVLAALIVVLFIPAMVRAGRRIRRMRGLASGTGTAESAWRELLETAEDVGIGLGPTLTPRGVVARLQRVKGMSGGSAEALERIRAAVEMEGYGRPAADKALGALHGPELAKDLSTVVACLRTSVDEGTRIRAALLPPSLVRRSKRAVARFA